MPDNSKAVVAFSEELKTLRDAVEKRESAQTHAVAADPESSMAFGKAATRLFYKRVMPYCADRFWGNAAAANRDGPKSMEEGAREAWESSVPLGKNEEQRITAIFSEIKGMILDHIIEDSATDQIIRDWVRTNKAALIDDTHPEHAKVMQESRTGQVTLSNGINRHGYLVSRDSVNQTAWRNFDRDAPIAAWDNYFVRHPIAEIQRRLAYYYLVVTDPSLSPDTLHFMRGNFIGKLGDIRRGHNDGRTARDVDDPSCPPGTEGSIAKMGDRHPVAELSDPLELIHQHCQSAIQQVLKREFENAKTLAEKMALRDALLKLSIANTDDVITGFEAYSDALFTIRQRFIAALGSEEKWVEEINTVLQYKELGELGREDQSKIHLIMLDPASVYGETILAAFQNSLTLEEQEKLEALAALEAPKSLAEQFNLLMEKERIQAKETQAEGSHIRTVDFSEVAMRNRVIQRLVAQHLGTEATIKSELLYAEFQRLMTLEKEEAERAMNKGVVPTPTDLAAMRQRVITALVSVGWGNESAINTVITPYEEDHLLARYKLEYKRLKAFFKRELQSASSEKKAIIEKHQGQLRQLVLREMLKDIYPDAGFMEPKDLSPLVQALSDRVSMVEDAVRFRAATAADLAAMAKVETDIVRLMAISRHRNADAVVLEAVARNDKSTADILEAVARNGKAISVVLGAVIGNDNANATVLRAVASNGRSRAFILQAVISHGKTTAAVLEAVVGNVVNADAAVLEAVARHDKVTAAVLEAIIGDNNVETAVLLAVAQNDKKATDDVLRAVARHNNTTAAVLKAVARNDKAEATALKAVARNDKATADILKTVVSKDKATDDVLKAVAQNGKATDDVLKAVAQNGKAEAATLEVVARNDKAEAAALEAVARNGKATAAILEIVVRNGEATVAVLEAVARHGKVEAAALEAVARNGKTEAAALEAVVRHDKAEAAALEVVATKAVDSAVLSRIAYHKRADTAVLLAVARNSRTIFFALSKIVDNNKAGAPILDAIARHKNADLSVLYKIAYHEKADANVLEAVARNNKADLFLLYRIVEKKQAGANILEAVAGNNKADTMLLEIIVGDERADSRVLEAVARNNHASATLLETIVGDERADSPALESVARNDKASATLLGTIVADERAYSRVLEAVARNSKVTDDVLEAIARNDKATAAVLEVVVSSSKAEAAALEAAARNDSANLSVLGKIANNNKSEAGALEAIVNCAKNAYGLELELGGGFNRAQVLEDYKAVLIAVARHKNVNTSILNAIAIKAKRYPEVLQVVSERQSALTVIDPNPPVVIHAFDRHKEVERSKSGEATKPSEPGESTIKPDTNQA